MERGILYSMPMILAKLAGTKTQTRRTSGLDDVNYQLLNKHIADWPLSQMRGFNGDMCVFDLQTDVDDYVTRHIKCHYGKVGDILYARETWRDMKHGFDYKADWPDRQNYRWKPSIHMPKAAARIWERIIEIRVERLQDISPGDACAEGIEYDNVDAEALAGGELQADFANYMWRDDPEHSSYNFPYFASCVDSYFSLWDSINGEGAHKLNPWVWVIKTEILSTTGRPADLKA